MVENIKSIKCNCIVHSPKKYRETEGIKDLSYSRVHGETRLNDGKMAEIKDRISM